MNSRPELRLDWCSHKAAKYAVVNWHYSRTMPVSKNVKIGVWEDGKFVGAIIYALGATPALGSPYGLEKFQFCELVRIALKKHKMPVSRMIAISLKMLKKQSPGIRLVVSFADTREGHHGGIYQAGNWIYNGDTKPVKTWVANGKILHRRAYTGVLYGAPKMKLPENAEIIELQPKHRYLMPLDKAMRTQILPLAKPYPKKKPAPEALSGDAPCEPAGTEGGSTPTSAL